MSDEHTMDNRTKTGAASLLLVLLLLSSGCSLTAKRSVEHASALSYVPFRAATRPADPTPYQAEGCFYGFHDTCWRSWPDCWLPCSEAKADCGTAEVLSVPAEETISSPGPEPVQIAVPPRLPPQ